MTKKKPINYVDKANYQCQAKTTQHYRCQNRGIMMVMYKGDEYLACKLHYKQELYFKPYTEQ